MRQIPTKYKQLYQQNWKTIRTSVKQGRLKDVYHYPMLGISIQEIVGKVMANYNANVKVNVAFGFILQNRTTGELKFFHPSNNTFLFDTPRLLRSPADLKNLIDDVEQEDVLEYARLQRPSTNWIVERIICVRFDVFKLH